jgi:hypothetical protein
MELKQNGILTKGFYYTAPAEYFADAEVVAEFTDLPDKKNIFNMVKGYQLYNKSNTDLPDLSFEFDEINIVQNDTVQFIYGKWLPNGFQSAKTEGSNNIFWLRRVDSVYDSKHKKVAVPKIIKPNMIAKKAAAKTYEERKNKIAETFISHEKDVNLEFYDNGVVDGDIISVYINDEPVLIQRKLNVVPIKLTVPMEKGKEYKVTMFAENLGIFPPNTAAMIINSGYVRKTIFLSADLESNVSVIFKRDN